jgi:hypothetical protein
MNKSNELRSIERRKRVQQAVKLYKKDVGIPKIAHEIGISTSTVETYLAEEGINLNQAPKAIKTVAKPKIVVKKVRVKKTRKGCPTGDQLLLLTIIIICLGLIIAFF